MKRFWFTFSDSSPLSDFTQPVLAKTIQEAKSAMYRFYAAFCPYYGMGDENPYKKKKRMKTIVVKDGVIKVELL